SRISLDVTKWFQHFINLRLKENASFRSLEFGRCQELTLVSQRRRLCKRKRIQTQPYCRQHSRPEAGRDQPPVVPAIPVGQAGQAMPVGQAGPAMPVGQAGPAMPVGQAGPEFHSRTVCFSFAGRPGNACGTGRSSQAMPVGQAGPAMPVLQAQPILAANDR
ncbi:circumsporozoite protein, partial [Aplysia californica]|uniref:Circumsporozoite protein n=1 Tax=Aplysia californica TaxID=6500 RepID=A0ABM1VS99_APLCA